MQALKTGWAGQTLAMARCSETNTKGKKTRNRLKKEERKSLVELFINKYRKENNGNFPSLSLTHKEVGGSFYTVREIVRELIQENRVLAPGSSHSQVLNLEYSEDREQPPLGPLSLEPASTFMVEINGHEVHETGGQIGSLHNVEDSQKLDNEPIIVSSKLTATGNTNTSAMCDQDIGSSLHEFTENKDLVSSACDESSLSDAVFLADHMQFVILDHEPLKPKNELDSEQDISSTRSTGSIQVEQHAVLKSASGSSISNSISVAEGEHTSVTEVKTEVTSFIGLEGSNSAEICTLDSMEQTEVDKWEVEAVQDGLSKSGLGEDLLSSFNSASSMNSDSGLKLDDEGNMSGTSFKIEGNSVVDEKRANHLTIMPPLSLDETSQTHDVSSNIAVEEVGTSIRDSVSDVSHNHLPHTDNEAASLHSSVDNSFKNPVAVSGTTAEQLSSSIRSEILSTSKSPSSFKASRSSLPDVKRGGAETTAEQLSPHIRSEVLLASKSPSSVKPSGSTLSDVKSESSKGTTHRQHAARETNPFVSALKDLFRAFAKFLMSDF